MSQPVFYETFSRFTRAEWRAQARAHLRLARALLIFGHEAGGRRQMALAADARGRARLLSVANACVRWGEAAAKRAAARAGASRRGPPPRAAQPPTREP